LRIVTPAETGLMLEVPEMIIRGQLAENLKID
jgi:hypothetical protein